MNVNYALYKTARLSRLRSAGKHVTLLNPFCLWPNQPSLLLLNATCLEKKHHITMSRHWFHTDGDPTSKL